MRTTKPHHKEVLKDTLGKFRQGDWFVLCQIGKSVHAYVFRELIRKLSNDDDDSDDEEAVENHQGKDSMEMEEKKPMMEP